MNNKITENDDEMLPEYDFTEGIRGKHYQAYRQGHSVTIYQEDGTTLVQYFQLEELEKRVFMLEPVSI